VLQAAAASGLHGGDEEVVPDVREVAGVPELGVRAVLFALWKQVLFAITLWASLRKSEMASPLP
jgi:hypothetical protein